MDEELLNDIRRTGSHFAKLSRFQRGHTPVKGEQAFRFYLSRHKKVQSGDFAKLLGFGTGRVANIAKSLEKKRKDYPGKGSRRWTDNLLFSDR